MNIRPVQLLTLCLIFFAALFSEASAAVTLDPNFGEDGRVAVELGIYGSRANAVLSQPDGKILVAGSSTSTADKDFMLFRLQPNGELDKNFNYDGTVTTAVGSYDDEALTLALQEDGKILAGGYTNNGENRDFALVRYNSDGSLDRDFGLEGMTVTAVGSSNDEITDMAVQKDGSIVITGAAQGKNGRVVVLARYKADGTLDTSFANDGFSLSMTGVDAQAESVALSKTGRILVSGSYSDGKKRGLMLLGFNAAGQLDNTFGEKGIAVPADSSTFSEGYGMFVTEDNKILVAGAVGEEGQRDAALFRFTAEGQPDSSFENNGALVASAGKGDDVLYDAAEVGEKIAAAGFKTVDEKRVFLLITYTKGGSADADNLSSSSVTMQAAESANTETLTTIFSDDDKSTAIANASNDSVVIVGESTNSAGSSAAVSKYLTDANTEENAVNKIDRSLDAGNQHVLTGEPYEVTRTTAILSGEILNSLSNVTERGFVFGTMPNPTKEGSSAADSSGAPTVTNTSASSISGTSVTISLTTDVDATCKYDTNAGTAYDDMASTFSTTGEKIHAQIVSDLETGTYTYYARCKNTASSVVNTTDTVISFTVTSSGTEDAPTVTNKTSSSVTGDSATLSLTTNVAATCKYDTAAETAYDDMTYTFSSTGGTSHSQTIDGLTSGTTYTYYARCKNTSSEAVNTTDTTISFTVNSSSGTDTTPPTVSEITAAAFNTDDDVILKVSTSEAATCKYSTTDTTYDDMAGTFTGSTSHSATLTLTAKEYTYFVRCKDDAGNISASKEISFLVTPVVITNKTKSSFSSTDPVIEVDTDVVATCKYSKDDDIDYERMTEEMNADKDSDGTSHSSAELKNLTADDSPYKYYVRCQNTSGKASPVGTKIDFTVSDGSTPPPPGASNFQPVINTALQGVGNFFVSTAYAQTVTDGTTSTTTTTSDTTSTDSKSDATSTADTTDDDFLEEGYVSAGSGNGTFSSKLKDLKPGTFFYARAYAISKGNIYYGNHVGFRTGDSCFVATAAFGSIFAPAVQTLRDFRNQFLSGNAVTRALVDFYYQVSPNIADVISQHSALRFAVRLLLLPVTGAAWLALQIGIWMLLLPGAAVLLLGGWQGLRRRRQSCPA